MKRIVARCALAALTLAPIAVQATTLSLSNTYALANTLSASFGNFHPQGMAYDASANELLFIQQQSNTIVRTNLSGSVLGARNVGYNHTVSVAADANFYYFSDYTANNSGQDLLKIGKTSGTATNFGSETAAFGGYPIAIAGGQLYRTNPTTDYTNTNLHQIRVSSMSTPDTITSTLTLAGAGIGDFAIDTANNSIWVLDYTASASIRRFSLNNGALLDTFNLGLDGIDAGLALANNTLFYYDWNASGSALRTYDIGGLATSAVPEPGSLALMGIAIAACFAGRRRKAA